MAEIENPVATEGAPAPETAPAPEPVRSVPDALPLAPALSRKAQLEAMMADTRGPYWNPHLGVSDSLQAEYRGIIESEQNPGAGPAKASHTAPESEPGAGADSLTDGAAARAATPEQLGIDQATFDNASATWDVLADALGEEVGAEIQTVLTGDPELHRAIFREIGQSYAGRVHHATPDELNEFAGTGAGSILVPKWRGDAGRRLGIALARIDRLEDGMSDETYDSWRRLWRFALTPQQRALILDKLTT